MATFYQYEDNIDGIPEDQKESWEKLEDGKYRRDATADFDTLKAKKGEAEKHRIEAEKVANDMKAQEADKIRQAEEKAREKALEEAKKSGNQDEVTKILKEQHLAELEAIKAEKAKLESEFDVVTRQNSIKTILANHPFLPDPSSQFQRDLIEKELINKSVAVVIDGKRDYYIKDDSGQATGVTVAQEFKNMVDAKLLDGITQGSLASGAGSADRNNARPGAVGNGQKTWANTSSADKVALRQSDPEAYQALLQTKN